MIILIALAVAAISMTFTQSSLFVNTRKLLSWKLFQCPYCFAHWVSCLCWACYATIHPKTMDPFDFVINVFATVAISVLPMIVIDYLNTRMDKHAKILHSSHSAL
ncbi:hypothetical protein LCGC14_1391920 [marine sediment metagenome]|uniref:DUF1360 domain-containing protein n=1 Tax=marine sediment metagenome TaxID=412755 RepID=A0A0F9JZS2_9ZZZZ